jgi:AcrR family transcriptional regulator
MARQRSDVKSSERGADGRGSYAPAQTRQMLLDNALELFGSQGFHATSVQTIVDQAGLTKGAFYHHFASKEDLLRLIHDQFLEVQRETADQIMAAYDSPVDQLREMVRASVLTVAQYRQHVAVFFQERRFLTGERASDVHGRRDAFEEQIESVVRAGIESGDFDPSISPRIALFGIVGMSAWVYQWFRPEGPLPVEEIADTLASMAVNGLIRRR